jgi:hypothetical protein
MQLSLQPEGFLETLIFQTGQIPRTALLAVMSMGVSQALIAAIRLNLFQHLQDRAMTVAELATAVKCDRFGIEILLESLEGFGFLQRQQDKYQLTSESIRNFTTAGDKPRRDFVYFFLQDVSRNLAQLEQRLQTGEPANFHFCPPSSACWSNYLTFLEGNGQLIAPKMVKWAKFDREPQRLLDVAGGPAQYSIAFCQRYPNLKADILELPESANYGRAIVDRAGLSDRIHYRESNLLNADWGSNYDVVLLFNILHNLSASECEIAITKSFEALRTGGTLLVEEPFHPGSDRRPTAFEGFISLVYFAMSGARTWTQLNLTDWLTAAGFTKIRVAKKQLMLFMSAQK